MGLNEIWEELEEKAAEDMKEEGFDKKDIEFEQIAYVRYGGQLEDVETVSPVPRLNSAEDVDALIDAFEKEYSSKYTEAAKIPEAGYQIFEVGIRSTVPVKVKPPIEKKKIKEETPPEASHKGSRKVYRGGEWKENALYELSELQAGNLIHGPAIIEAPDTTLPIPEDCKVKIDEYERMWLKNDG